MNMLDLASHLALWVVVIVQAVFLLALARQIGLLHARLGRGGARIMNTGLSIGESAPSIDILDVSSRRVALGMERGKRTLLLFISTGCSTCASLIPGLKELARHEKDDLEVYLIAFGTSLEASREFAEAHSLDSIIPLILSDELALRYKITISPYGILVDKSGVLRAKGLVNTLADIESLLYAEEMGIRSVDEFMNAKMQRSAANKV